MNKIKVDISSSRPIFIEADADADSFGETFARMADDDQLAVLRAMVEHMKPHRIQWDFIALKLEKPENHDVRDQLRDVLFITEDADREREAEHA